MTKGEKWKEFISGMGWIADDVISGRDSGTLKIFIKTNGDPDSRKSMPIEAAMIHKEYDILCYETPSGTVFFQWDDILQIKLEIDKKKRGWL